MWHWSVVFDGIQLCQHSLFPFLSKNGFLERYCRERFIAFRVVGGVDYKWSDVISSRDFNHCKHCCLPGNRQTLSADNTSTHYSVPYLLTRNKPNGLVGRPFLSYWLNPEDRQQMAHKSGESSADASFGQVRFCPVSWQQHHRLLVAVSHSICPS